MDKAFTLQLRDKYIHIYKYTYIHIYRTAEDYLKQARPRSSSRKIRPYQQKRAVQVHQVQLVNNGGNDICNPPMSDTMVRIEVVLPAGKKIRIHDKIV